MMQYPSAELVWAQEEPRNQGCWSYVNERLGVVCNELAELSGLGRNHDSPPDPDLEDLKLRTADNLHEEAMLNSVRLLFSAKAHWTRRLKYVGRHEYSASAPGTMVQHRASQQKIIQKALSQGYIDSYDYEH